MKNYSLTCVFLIVCLVGGLSFVSTTFFSLAEASTSVNSMIITSDTTWTKANSPYTLNGPIAVANGATLAIEPGVAVNLGTYYLQVNGTLRARGSSADKITFTSMATEDLFQISFTDGSTSWNEQADSGSIIENAIINASISVSGVSPKISNNNITDNTAGMMNTNNGIYIESGSPIVTNNYIRGAISIDGEGSSLISNNIITGGMGIYKGSHVISNNEISGGSSYFWIGRSFERDYDVVVVGSGSTVISGNKIHGNTLGIGSYEHTQVNAIISNNVIYGCGTGISLGTSDGGTLTIKGNLITNNTGNGIEASGKILQPIEGNLITNNGIGIRISPGAQVTVQKNTIANNSIGISTGSDLATISNNNIQNIKYNVQLQQGTSKDINATDNWWGTTDTQLISQSIFDNKNDYNLGKVNFIPFLTAPNPDAPAITMVPSSKPASNPSTSSPSSSPSPDSNSSSTPSSSPVPSDNSTIQEPMGQTDNNARPQLDIQEIVIATLVGLVIALSIVIIVMHRKIQKKRQEQNKFS